MWGKLLEDNAEKKKNTRVFLDGVYETVSEGSTNTAHKTDVEEGFIGEFIMLQDQTTSGT